MAYPNRKKPLRKFLASSTSNYIDPQAIIKEVEELEALAFIDRTDISKTFIRSTRELIEVLYKNVMAGSQDTSSSSSNGKIKQEREN